MVPVVVTTSWGAEDYANGGKNAIVVPRRNPLRMADAVLYLTNNSEVVERLSFEGIQTAKERSGIGSV